MKEVDRQESKSVYLSIGSNIEPQKNLHQAINYLRSYTNVEQISTAWETPPVGGAGPNFLNAVVLIRSNRTLEIIKREVIREIEARLGRIRSTDKYAPRTIDLDILLYDQDIVEQQIWTLAHLAVPLAELLPEFVNPNTGETVSEAATRLARHTSIFPRPDVLVRWISDDR